MIPLDLKRMQRRHFLRSGAICLGLPLMEAMLPSSGRALERAVRELPKRLVLVGRGLGVHAEHFFPADTGIHYKPSRALGILERHRGRFTAFFGLSHPGYPNTHHTEAGLFTGVTAERVERFEHLRNTVSLDQHVAAGWATSTRISSLVMGGWVTTPMSYDAQGVPVPSERNPAEVFKRLFINGSADHVQQELKSLAEGRSILDGLLPQLKRLGQSLGARDRDRLARMTAAVRGAEEDLLRAESWAAQPKPQVPRKLNDFSNPGWSTGQRMRYDLAALALQTDATRVVISTETVGVPGDVEGTLLGQHDASHHGRDPGKLEQFSRFEDEETRNFAMLLDKLAQREDGEPSLLDQTTVLWASNLGNPSAHSSSNLPILVAGGGYRHQGHIRFEPDRSPPPLSNLYLTILEHLGLPANRFGTSTGVLPGWA